MFFGYFIIGLALFIFIIFRLCRKGKTKEARVDADNKVVAVIDDISSTKHPIAALDGHKTGFDKSEISAASADQSAVVSSSLIVLTSPVVNGLRFEDLLNAPAKLLGRGKHGSCYKVICNEGIALTVKRNNLTQFGLAFDWKSRLGIAATIAEALAFMHHELDECGIPHGNLKSSNILFSKNMQACISEYGLMRMDSEDRSLLASVNKGDNNFKTDIYGFGIILLELLTGKVVEGNVCDLAKWVLSVVREGGTIEVFDKILIQEGANQERMLNLLQLAIKCVSSSMEARPSISQVALTINPIKEEEERSMVSEA